ncbi:MAG: S8 family serine peptidase [Lachnospiraceae bacterium]|nr:S8 family serine peptidase [Lachnospiraceae bacterium]
MKAKKLSKVILSFALSAALLIEPVAGMATVQAQEAQPMDESLSEDQNTEDVPTDNETGDDLNQDEANDSDGSVESGQETNKSEEENGTGTENESEEENGEDEGDSSEGANGAETEGDSEDGDEVEIEDNSEEENDELTEEEISEKAEEDTEETESDLDGFSAMPSGYKLSASQKKLKEGLASLCENIDESDEGGVYAARRVYTFADNQETAEMIAEAYHAEIISFDMGVLTLRVSDDKTVKQVLKIAADMDNNLPPVWPDYRNELYEEVVPEVSDTASDIEIIEEEYMIEGSSDITEADGEEIPSLAEYEQVLNELNGFGDEYLNPTSDSYQWFHTTIGSPYAWDAGYLGEDVKVGVVDSGVDVNNDLEANIIDRRDFCDGTPNAYDEEDKDDKHGTHVAGIIAATANNSQGVGVAPKAKIYNAKVFGANDEKSGYDSTIMAALNYLLSEENNADLYTTSATSAKVDIINMSLGGPAKNFDWDYVNDQVYSPFQLILNKAYKKGVTVFVATGNDGGSLAMYPASYDHVIGVAATDTNNQRAYFSNYGISTDLAAPGVNIYSTLGDGYDSLQGTSMACPVAAGEAAVILSGAKDLPELKDKTGKDRVDALTSIMQKNTISAGSGMGKGITSLPKVFKLSTAAAKPNAPQITPDMSDDKQSVKITIKVQAGMSLCYTTNGKNPVYKNEETDANTTYVDSTELTDNKVILQIDCTENASGTVKAFAINASGVIGPVKSVTYKFSPYIRGIAISGPAKVEVGKSIQLTAEITPAYATNKNLTWTITNANGTAVDTAKIKIDPKKGKITATAADLGTYKVTATAQDEGHETAEFTVEVVKAGTALQSITFAKSANKELWLTKTGAESRELVSDLTVKEKNEAGELVDIDISALNGRVVWTSSKPAIATVDYSTGKITAKAVGSTTITAKANDSSNKKATINITVKQAVTGIEITTDKGKTDDALFAVAAGKNMTLKAALTPKKPTNSKVEWSISPEDSNVTINPSNGKITVKKEAVRSTYTVTATAADGKGVVATQTIEVYSGAIGEIKLDSTKETLYTKYISSEKTNTKIIRATIKGANGASDFNPGAYAVTSSNEAIVTAAVTSSSGGVVDIAITATGSMYGKANVIIMATDGSNKKATCAVTVSGGIKKVELQDAAGKKVSKMALFRNGTTASAPKTAELTAMIEGSEGANELAYDVTSSNPKLVKVALNKTTGKITLTTSAKSTGKVTITLMATDGSKKKATCTVTVSNPPTRVNVAPKGGETGCVVPGKSVQFTATMEMENGAVSGKNVVWSFADDEAAALASLGIKINPTSGKITVPKTFKTAQGTIDVNKTLKSWGVTSATVCATAKDGSGVQGTADFYLAPATTFINVGEPYQDPVTYVMIIPFTSDCFFDMTCSSSSPKVASPTIVYIPRKKDGAGGTGYIKFVGNTSGTVSFTLKALDGSNKQAKTVTIKFQ